jgi:hypothetical protein
MFVLVHERGFVICSLMSKELQLFGDCIVFIRMCVG